MELPHSPRTKWLNIRMTEEEYAAAESLKAKTDCHSLSDYARKAVLGKPVVLRYRDSSLDDFIKAMIPLQKELKAIGNNFNQAVRRLHALKNVPDIQQWILLNESDKTRLFRQIDIISVKINEAYKSWSQK
jgi:hypothetical protein